MGALAIPHGDAGFQFDFLGGYRMQIMVYAGDEEFPPSSQVLYSDNFETGFAAEDRVVAGDILISAIKARDVEQPYGPPPERGGGSAKPRRRRILQ